MTGIERLGAFLRSPHHAWLALLTLGVGVATANVPGMIVAAAGYALGWIFLPDSRWFRGWLAKRGSSEREASAEAFRQQREAAYGKLSGEGRHAYDELARSIEKIRENSGGDTGPHAGRLGQLAWTYLRLLLTREALAGFCGEEDSDEIGREIAGVREEIAALERECGEAEERGAAIEAGGAVRLLQSKQRRLESLERRAEHVKQAESDLALTHAEVERILDAVRLIQADLMTRRDPDAMGEEIDRTTAHFHRTRDWLRDLEFDRTPSDISDEVTAAVPLQVEREGA